MTREYTICPRCGFAAVSTLYYGQENFCHACGYTPVDPRHIGVYHQAFEALNHTGVLVERPPAEALAALEPADGDYCTLWNHEEGVLEILVGDLPGEYCI
jgi:hypothetical protein